MPCPRKRFFSQSGSAKLEIDRKSNINKMTLRWEDVDRPTHPTQPTETKTFRTAALEAGVTFDVETDHSYNLFLSVVRKATTTDGSVEVTLRINGTSRVNRECSADGSNPTGEWLIVA